MRTNIVSICGLILVTSLLGSCGSKPLLNKKAVEYKVIKDGIVTESDRHNYDPLGDTTFTRTQAFKVKRISDPNDKFVGTLYLKKVTKVGDLDVDESPQIVLIDSGEGKFVCQHYYDVKTAKIDEIKELSCVVTLLGENRFSPVSEVK